MKTNMTERDKKLLVSMLIGVIIVAIGYWGIIPQVKAYNELESKIEKEEDTQKINKLKIQNTALIEMQADEYEEKLAAVKDDFYPIMDSSEIDKMMTELATKYGLNIYSLKFSMPKKPTTRKAYTNSKLYKKQKELIKEYNDAVEKNESSSTTSSSTSSSSGSNDSSSSKTTETSAGSTQDVMNAVTGAEEGGYQPNTQVYAVPVAITVGGEVGTLERFLEEVGQLEKTALLTSYSWGEYRSYVVRDADGNIVSASGTGTPSASAGVSADDLEQNAVVRKSLTVNLEIYMCDTSVVKESKSENESDGADASEE